MPVIRVVDGIFGNGKSDNSKNLSSIIDHKYGRKVPRGTFIFYPYDINFVPLLNSIKDMKVYNLSVVLLNLSISKSSVIDFA